MEGDTFDTKRFLLAVLIAGLALMGWNLWMSRHEGRGVRGGRGASSKAARTKAGGPGARGHGPAAGSAVRGAKARPVARSKAQAVRRGQVVVVDGRLYRAKFQSVGAGLASLRLKGRTYKERIRGGKVRQVDLVRTVAPANLPLKVTFWGKQVRLSEPGDWEVGRLLPGGQFGKGLPPEREHGVVRFAFRLVRGPLEVIKAFEMQPDARYDFEMRVRLANRGTERLKGRLTISVPSMDFGEKGRSFFRPVSLQREAACRVNGDVKVRTFGQILGREKRGCGGGGCGGCGGVSCQRTPAKANAFAGKISWFGVDEKYFLLAAAPVSLKDTAQCRFGALPRKRGGLLWTDLNYPEVEVQPGQAVEQRLVVFGGPKRVEALEMANRGLSRVAFEDSVDFGILGFLGKPMVWLMKVLFGWLGNWGLAIIVVTILIKLLTLPWTTKSMRSMRQMQRLKPEMDALKEKYGEDKVRYQQEVAALMKRHEVSPLGGCLPMLLQMPIYIAWYQALMASVELYRAPLFGWIDDLTAPDRYFVLPILMGVAMFAQQKMTPAAADNPQAKMMGYMMPIMFTAFMLFLPSGLTLYILVNVLVSMVHQWYLAHAEAS